MKIFVITHKKFDSIISGEIYVPLLVGADFHTGERNYLQDNSIIPNISYKNKSFCELTGAYWIMHAVTEDIVGICHYRRYFCGTKRFFRQHFILNEKNIRRILSAYDIILPSKGHYEYNDKTAKAFFAEKHDVVIWEQCKQIISCESPEFLPDFEWFEKETTGYCYNMLISQKDIFDAYHCWLFSILFLLEKKADLSQHNDYNSRMYGFLSERLLNIWVHHHHLRIKEMPVYNTESSRLVVKLKRKLTFINFLIKNVIEVFR